MKVVFAAVSLAVLAGCASKPPTAQSPAPAPAAAAAPAPAPAPAPAARTAAAAALTPSEEAQRRIANVEPAIYFDFDRFEVKSEFAPTVSAYGNYLTVLPNARMVIEGNADERGTVEYNLALGQKRAEAAKAALVAAGARAANIEAVSNGEEKPRNLGKTEQAYAENRRADLLLR